MKKSIIAAAIFSMAQLNIYSVSIEGRTTMPDDRRAMINKVRTGSKTERINTIRTCSWHKHQFCYRPMVDNLNSPFVEIRFESVKGLGILGIRDAIPHLEELLEKENSKEVISVIIWSLGMLDSKDSLEKIIPYLDHEDPAIRRNTGETLGRIGGEKAENLLKARIEKEEINRTKIHMIAALVRIDKTEADYRRMLIEQLSSEEMWVRYHAARAIYEFSIWGAARELKKAMMIEDVEMVRDELYKAYVSSLRL